MPQESGFGIRLKGLHILIAAILVWFPFRAAYEQESFDDFLKQQNREYEEFEKRQTEDFEQYVQEVMQKWNEFKNSTRRDWYEYSHDLNTVSKVDFEEGEITIETIIPKDEKDIAGIAEKNISEHAKKLVSTDSLTNHNILQDQLELAPEKKVDSSNVDKFVREKVLPKMVIEKETIKSKDGVERVKVKATFKMVPNHLRIRAEKYLPLVKKYCGSYELEVPLVMAIMQTESYFNPRAKSSAPAYGLMQLVPKSGAREAYKYVFKQDKIVRPRYLYIPENNVQLGCAYLAKMRDYEFKDVNDPDKIRYCIVASYNTGPGNLSRAITGDRKVNDAVKRINEIDKDKLFLKLRKDLPYAETRDYLEKVEKRREDFVEWR